MEEFHGKAIADGIAIGRIAICAKQNQVNRVEVSDAKLECRRVEAAQLHAIEELQALYQRALSMVGEEEAMIFEVHRMMLEDDDYLKEIARVIEEQLVNAEYAVSEAGESFAKMFIQMDDEYMKERAADIRDVSERLIRSLAAAKQIKPEEQEDQEITEEPVILMADNLAPSETLRMEKDKMLAFVTRLGSTNAHTAILARSIGIPALCGLEIDETWNGRLAIVDGFNGTLYIDPSEAMLQFWRGRMVALLEERRQLASLKGTASITLDGIPVKLYANVGNVSETISAISHDAEGIGLLRSEFLYLRKKSLPTEDEQFRMYKTVASKMAGKPVVIRTLDIGADKSVDYLHMEKEENPALGCRAIRFCLKRPDIFKTQLRALLRAGVCGNISVMYPMITSLEELRQVKRLMNEAVEELKARHVDFRELSQGIMIETPAAVMISRELADEVDFFSIGTNDLIQYTLAIDRQSPDQGEFYDPHHPAVLRMIQMVVENGHAGGCWVGICGELGADLTLTETFLKMGVDELSVVPASVLPLRQKIRGLTAR